ncbi:cytochrome P450 [Karstenula rhodostoma CBS 690.94]|uniref:Cytochrome P450 n=1 Tax=Karstenula rhodostoma CBS 690.94 TaxID=1392251 RepID=A0A9P4PLH4_9PLEO|nr:cytochrome P450 [Karstenula rhodostoma CBS 690.94]
MQVIREEVLNAFEREVDGHDGYREVHLGDLVELVNARLNTMWTLGDEFAHDCDFMKKAVAYSKEAKIISELAKLLPSFIIGVLGLAFKRISGNERYIQNVMLQLIQTKQHHTEKNTPSETPTILDVLLQRAPSHWETIDFLREMNVTWNTTNFVTPVLIAGVIQDLGRHQTYHPALLQEASCWDHTQSTDRLRLLDAFITESMRTQCFSSTRIHRIALCDFTFFDGYTVATGHTVGFNIRKHFNDEAHYPSATTFVAERHLEALVQATDVSVKWPFWGSQRLPCPGRFYAVHVAKLLSVSLLENWVFEIRTGQPQSMLYREYSIPHPRLKLRLKRKVNTYL